MNPASLRAILLGALLFTCTVAYIPWLQDPFRSFREGAFHVAAFGIVLLWCYSFLTGPKDQTLRWQTPHETGMEYPLALFGSVVGGLLISCVANGSGQPAITTVGNVLAGGVIFFAFHTTLDLENSERWTRFFLATAFINGITGIFQYFRFNPFFESLDPAFHNKYPKYLVAGFMDNPAMLAPFLASFIPYLFSRFMLAADARRAAAWAGGLILLLTPVALTKNLAANAALALVMPGLLAYFAIRLGNRGRHLGRIAVSLGAGALLVAVALVSVLRENEESKTIKMYSVEERMTQNRAALMMFAESPMVGKGPGFFFSHFPEYRRAVWMNHPPRRLPAQVAHQVHNDYLQLLAEGGVITAVPVAALILYLLWKMGSRLYGNLRLESDSPAEGFLAGGFGGLLVLLIDGIGNFPFHIASLAVTALFWTALAMRMQRCAP